MSADPQNPLGISDMRRLRLAIEVCRLHGTNSPGISYRFPTLLSAQRLTATRFEEGQPQDLKSISTTLSAQVSQVLGAFFPMAAFLSSICSQYVSSADTTLPRWMADRNKLAIRTSSSGRLGWQKVVLWILPLRHLAESGLLTTIS